MPLLIDFIDAIARKKGRDVLLVRFGEIESLRNLYTPRSLKLRPIQEVKHYPEEFKIGAVKQITDRGYPAAELTSRLRTQVGYRRHACRYGRPEVVATNRLEQNFDVEAYTSMS